jgi:hypothetical protein
VVWLICCRKKIGTVRILDLVPIAIGSIFYLSLQKFQTPLLLYRWLNKGMQYKSATQGTMNRIAKAKYIKIKK